MWADREWSEQPTPRRLERLDKRVAVDREPIETAGWDRYPAEIDPLTLCPGCRLRARDEKEAITD
jgi:hypothetical protein